MAPGPLTTSSRGGFGFGLQHRGGNYGREFSALSTGRTYGPRPGVQRQRFYLDGNGHGVLEAGDKLTVTVDDEVNPVVSVGAADNGKAEEADEGNSGNGNGEEEPKRPSFFRRHDKMAISSNSDGSVSIRPEGDDTLQVVGDPLSGAVTVIEVEPEALAVAGGRYQRPPLSARRYALPRNTTVSASARNAVKLAELSVPAATHCNI